jgi:CubicO group peptidase (beta-lactamase class C family)
MVMGAGILLAAACGPRLPSIVGGPPERLEPVAALVDAPPRDVGMDRGLTERLDSIVEAALSEGTAPGAVLAVGRFGRLIHHRAYGRLDRDPRSAPADTSTLWDLASVTKVVGTTTAAMMLEDEGRLVLDSAVAHYVPGLDAPEKRGITVRMLLEHRGGFESFAPLFREYRGPQQYLQQINRRPLRAQPGDTTVYSDWDLILLQFVVESVAGEPLDRFLARRVFGPLGMRETRFVPPPALRPRIAPTEVDSVIRGGQIWGEVHDPNAWAMGGVAGHAGLFSTARDLAVFAQTMLNAGEYGGVRLVRPEAVPRWTSPQNRGSSRALGWDTPAGTSSAGRYFGPRSFGHTGYTGTSLWVDPDRDLFVVLLTNRVNPTSRNNRHTALRRDVADAVQAAVLDAPLIDWEARRAAAAPRAPLAPMPE